MSRKPRILFIIPAAIIACFLLHYSCAKVGTITGGEKDITPPVVVETNPGNYSTGFTGSKIVVSFDEYLTLKDINQEFVISPLLETEPEVKLKGKNIEIVLPADELKENTTYTLNFGNAITDYTEGNVLPNYEFVFSTGSHIDSLSVRGQVLHAFNLEEPEEPLFVMLYENLNDSAPLLEKPSFLTRTVAEGFYAINNLPSDSFRLFALKDANRNLIFDQPTEMIAFLDTIIHLKSSYFTYEEKEAPVEDTTLADTLVNPLPETDSIRLLSDTLMLDSLYKSAKYSYALYADLYLFEQDVFNQYLSDYSRSIPYRLRLIFNEPLTREINIFLADTAVEGDWFLPEHHVVGDTIDYWLTDSSLYKKENLRIGVEYFKTDSMGELEPATDTLVFNFAGKKQNRRRDREDSSPGNPNNKLSVNAGSGKFHLNSHVVIKSTYPVDTLYPEFVHLYRFKDTIQVPVRYELEKDSIELRKYHLHFKVEEGTKYRFVMNTGAFRDIYRLGHDTTDISFTTRLLDSYGKLIVSMPGDGIIQLLQNDKVVYERISGAGEKAVFDYIEPKSYRLKVIFDRNGNGEWDTGNYLEGRQPEKVWFHEKEVEIKEGWDLELDLDIKEK